MGDIPVQQNIEPSAPLLKNQRIDEEGEVEPCEIEEEEEDEEAESGESQYGSDIGEETMKVIREYNAQVKLSDGFDVDTFPNVPFFDRLFMLDFKEVHPCVKERVEESTIYAISQYNKEQGAKLEFLEILKANYKLNAGFIFYTTFLAKDTQSEVIKTYQTQVYDDTVSNGRYSKVYIFRVKGEK